MLLEREHTVSSSVPRELSAGTRRGKFVRHLVVFRSCCSIRDVLPSVGLHTERRTIRCRHVRARPPVQNELVRGGALLSERCRWHVVGSQDEHADDLVASVVGNAADEVAGLERQRRFDDDVRARRSHEGLAE